MVVLVVVVFMVRASRCWAPKTMMTMTAMMMMMTTCPIGIIFGCEQHLPHACLIQQVWAQVADVGCQIGGVMLCIEALE